MTAPVTGQERTEPVAVDTIVTGEWIITLNADREIYRDGAIAVSGGVITEVGKRAAILAKYLLREPQLNREPQIELEPQLTLLIFQTPIAAAAATRAVAPNRAG